VFVGLIDWYLFSSFLRVEVNFAVLLFIGFGWGGISDREVKFFFFFLK